MLKLKNTIRWCLYVLTRNPNYLPIPADVAEQTRQESINRIWKRLDDRHNG
jgi:hypothetical protein